MFPIIDVSDWEAPLADGLNGLRPHPEVAGRTLHRHFGAFGQERPKGIGILLHGLPRVLTQVMAAVAGARQDATSYETGGTNGNLRFVGRGLRVQEKEHD